MTDDASRRTGEDEIRRQCLALMSFRVAILTVLLMSAFVVEATFVEVGQLGSLYVLTAIVYCLTLVYALVYVRFGVRSTFVGIQLGVDLAVVTGFVHLTGGLGSPFSFLYLLPIMASSLFLRQGSGYVFAAVSALLYGMLVELSLFGIDLVPSLEYFKLAAVSGREVSYALLVHVVGFGVTAYLGSYVAEALRDKGRELEEKSGDLDDLRALNRIILDGMDSGLIATDRFGAVTFVNRVAGELTGRGTGELLGSRVGDVLGMVGLMDRVRKALPLGRQLRFEHRLERFEADPLHLAVSVSVLEDRTGEVQGFIFLFMDRTEFHAMEEELRLSERMSALGEMAASVAHELRNPLASISGSVQVLREGVDPSDETAELMEIILKESRRLDRIIGDFLLFARPGRLVYEEIDLARLVGDGLRLLENSPEMMPGHEVDLDCELEGVRCVADSNRLKQLFWNLANNALKAMPHGGHLRIGMRKVGEDRVELIFSDEGVGMNDEQVRDLFRPFRGTFSGGSGLGLATVYRIVQEHHGTIRVRTAPGEGTVVTVTLPRRPREVVRGARVRNQLAAG